MKPQKKRIQKPSAKVTVIKDNKNSIRVMMFVIFVLSFLVYSNTFRNGYVLDDFSVIKENWVVKKGVPAIPIIMKTSYRYGYWNSADELYRPLSLVMFAVEWQLWPDNPRAGHIINLLLYALACVLLFTTLRKVFEKYNVFLPFIATVIFALHPIHTEVVSNIKSRDEILSFFFLVLTLRYAFNYIHTSKSRWIIFAMISYFLAFLSKESAITFLAVIPLTIYFFSDASLRKNLVFSGLMLIPAFLFLAIRSKVLANQPDLSPISSADNLLVAAPDFITRNATAIKILGKYLWMLLIPYPLVCDYSFNQIPIVGAGNLWFLISLFVLIFLTAFALWKFKTKSIVSFSVLFFIITMSLYSNLLMLIGSSFGERFLFVPSLAFCLIVSWGIMKLSKVSMDKIPITTPSAFFKIHQWPVFIILPIVLLYSAEIFSRNKDWESNLSLYSADAMKSPNSAHMRYYYGLVLMKDKAMNKELSNVEQPAYLDSAIVQFSIAAKIIPTFADAYDQIGLAYYRKNQNDSALKYYDLALQLNPTKSITYSNMGVIYFTAGKYDKALEAYEKCVKFDPAFSDGWMNLGSTYGTLGKFKEAIAAFEKCIEFNPQNATATYFIGVTYKSMGDETNAKIYMDKAASLDPKYIQK